MLNTILSRAARLAPLSALALLASCTITINASDDLEGSGGEGPADAWQSRTLLADTRDDQGTRTRHRLVRSGDRSVAILREVTSEVELAELGVEVSSVDSKAAQERAIEPWRGVLVTEVQKGGSAASAGLVPGDVVVSLAGVPLTSMEQFEDVGASLEPRSRVPAVVSSPGQEGRVERPVEIVVAARSVEESATTRVPLEPSPLLVERAGVELATLPEDIALALRGDAGPYAMVAGVWLGGPAYREGLRGGDIVERVNGVTVRTPEDVVALVQAGAPRLDFEVVGPLGAHRAGVELVEDVTETSGFDIPILVEHSSRVGRSRTSVLDFIFQFGWNHRTRALSSDTRKPASSSHLSILPFGMFEFTRRPGVSKNRIFWFITWGKGD